MPKKNQGQETGMRHVREILRLRLFCGRTSREISRSLQISHSTVQKYEKEVKKLGLDWSKIAMMSDDELLTVVRTRNGGPSH